MDMQVSPVEHEPGEVEHRRRECRLRRGVGLAVGVAHTRAAALHAGDLPVGGAALQPIGHALVAPGDEDDGRLGVEAGRGKYNHHSSSIWRRHREERVRDRNSFNLQFLFDPTFLGYKNVT